MDPWEPWQEVQPKRSGSTTHLDFPLLPDFLYLLIQSRHSSLQSENTELETHTWSSPCSYWENVFESASCFYCFWFLQFQNSEHNKII